MVQDELNLSNQKLVDSRKIIDDVRLKYVLCEETIKFEKEKNLVLEKYSLLLQEELRKERTNNKWIKIGSGGIIALLITGLILK